MLWRARRGTRRAHAARCRFPAPPADRMPPCAPCREQDHKPNDIHELARIVAAGGKVARTQHGRVGPEGPYRVFLPTGVSPGLSVARAFGDLLLSKARRAGWQQPGRLPVLLQQRQRLRLRQQQHAPACQLPPRGFLRCSARPGPTLNIPQSLPPSPPPSHGRRWA